MGPCVEFISRINGSFSKNKLWVNFLFVKTPNRGGRGRFGKSPDFSAFFFVKPSLTKNFFLYFEIIHCTEMLCFLNCKENICAFKNYPPKCSDRSSFDGRGENWKVSHGHTSGAAFFFKVFTFCCTFLLATLQVMLFKIMFCFCVTVVSLMVPR